MVLSAARTSASRSRGTSRPSISSAQRQASRVWSTPTRSAASMTYGPKDFLASAANPPFLSSAAASTFSVVADTPRTPAPKWATGAFGRDDRRMSSISARSSLRSMSPAMAEAWSSATRLADRPQSDPGAAQTASISRSRSRSFARIAASSMTAASLLFASMPVLPLMPRLAATSTLVVRSAPIAASSAAALAYSIRSGVSSSPVGEGSDI